MTPGDDEIAAQADPALGQHFLVSAEKLSKLVAAAGIRPEDDVVELGAGVGTVARELPRARSLTVVEFDGRLLRISPAERALRACDPRRRTRDNRHDFV